MELSVLNKRRKTNRIKWRKVAHGNPDITGTWGKGPATSDKATAWRNAHPAWQPKVCNSVGHGNTGITGRDRLP